MRSLWPPRPAVVVGLVLLGGVAVVGVVRRRAMDRHRRRFDETYA